MIRSNLSQMAREIDYLGKAIFKDVGDALALGIWEEFEILVKETAQWTGTTAASWNLSMGGDQSFREQPERSRQQALSKGHSAAVQVALAYNFGKLDDITEKYRYQAVVIENHAPGANRTELGPLREVNQPSGALARFEQRVAFKTFELIRSRKL